MRAAACAPSDARRIQLFDCRWKPKTRKGIYLSLTSVTVCVAAKLMRADRRRPLGSLLLYHGEGEGYAPLAPVLFYAGEDL